MMIRIDGTAEGPTNRWCRFLIGRGSPSASAPLAER
jgi:hypothetical protein